MVLTGGAPEARQPTDVVLHTGGGVSLPNEDGVRFFYPPVSPEDQKPYASGQFQALDACFRLSATT